MRYSVLQEMMYPVLQEATRNTSGIMIIVVGNGCINTSSNPGQGKKKENWIETC